MYSDQSWILTFEFFSDDDISRDITCLVRSGSKDEAYDATTSQIEKLPTLRLGPELLSDDKAFLDDFAAALN